ncbi:RER2 [Candida jiufengensis]|uniref:RER2 n=1 Tax=Candida jiufengensis TaxID=497108 RepID=UPI002224ECC1|nr:RER2 [Candida jiufengensis]KAI5956183.1 RER2 [Candida jiufengensis]
MSDWISTFPGYNQVLTTGKKLFGKIISTGPVPQHVGIIMDGNRRYAKSHKIEIKEGHSMGFDTMANILELLYEAGVKSATVYAFSIENFNRSSYEVKWLMDLAKSKFTQINQNGLLCEDYGVKIKILGNLKLLPPDLLKILRETEEITKNNTRAVLNVCFPYTSRDEITNSIKKIVIESTKSNIKINEKSIEDNLYTGDSPPLDLLVRTSGTYRLSDFLLWQAVSPDCAVVFTDKLWPEFKPWDMLKILMNWSFNKYYYGNPNGQLQLKNIDQASLLENSSTLEVSDSDDDTLKSEDDLDIVHKK